MDVFKLAKIDAFRLFLMNNDFNFREHPNGHFQVFDDRGRLIYQIWATTEKMDDVLSDKRTLGNPMIKKKLLMWLNRGKI